MASESSPLQNIENVNIPREIDAPLNSPIISVPSVITINDSDNENNFDDGVIVIDSDEDEDNEMNRKLLNKYNRRLKYKMRRAINILLRYNNHLSEKEISYLENKKNVMRCKKSNDVAENVENCVSSVESKRLRSEQQNLRGLETLRRRYIEAIKSSYEILETWLSHDKSDCALPNVRCMQWARRFIINDNYVSVAQGCNGEIDSNDLDNIVKNIDFSDSESSSDGSEIISSVESEYSSPDIHFDNGECYQHQSLNPYYTNAIEYNEHVIRQERLQRLNQRLQRLKQQLQRRKQRLIRRKQRLIRRQRLRNRFEIIHKQCYNSVGKFQVSSLSGHLGEEKHCSDISPSTSMVDGVEPLQSYVHTIIQGADVSQGNNTQLHK